MARLSRLIDKLSLVVLLMPTWIYKAHNVKNYLLFIFLVLECPISQIKYCKKMDTVISVLLLVQVSPLMQLTRYRDITVN
jgi:hypothetical protein